MRTALNSSTAGTLPNTASKLPVNNMAGATFKEGKAVPAVSDDDALDARLRQKISPKDYSYAVLGAFAEGTYTEF
jgi:hypothetical protein